MSSSPSRRSKVEPIETNFKSSTEAVLPQAVNTKPPRKFAPEPIETTTRTRRVPPTPIETPQLPSRRVSEEPIEITTQSARNGATQDAASGHGSKPGHKRGRSREKFAQDWESQTTRDKAVQQPTTERQPEPGKRLARRSREQFAQDWESETAKNSSKEKRPPRRFTPQLLETARRSRRAGDSPPAIAYSGKTDAAAGDWNRSPTKTRRRTPPSPPANTPIIDMSHNPLFLEIQRATSPLTRRRPSWASIRSQHSFRVPELEPIESSESEAPSPVSPQLSRPATKTSRTYGDATRMRESVDDRSSGYVLEPAAKDAEDQLRDQAMAAFPNDDHHEHVDHFIDTVSDDAECHKEGAISRRESCVAENNWAMLEMQRHREKMDKQAKSESDRKKPLDLKVNGVEHTDNTSEKVTAQANTSTAKNQLGEAQKDSELDPMRKSACPPMLGSSLEFPRCQSPEPAHFDPTQGCDAAKMARGYLSKQQSQVAEKGESLWCGANLPNTRPSLYSAPNSKANSRSPSHGGLWGGSCVNTGLTTPQGPTGLLTPRVELTTPHSPCSTPAKQLLPPTPPPSSADFACIDEKLAAEAAIEEDFGDDFVTQVYNYLSLGYPSIARMFDGELSKIAHIPVSELRQDDHLPSSRGYIRLGEDGNLTDVKITEETCMRWRALREYIRVWARQHPNMAPEGLAGGGETAVRKGSWAV